MTAVADWVRRWSYNAGVARVVRVMGLGRMARSVYGRVFRPRDGLFRVETAGVQARFAAPTPEEFRVIELAWLGERTLIDSLLHILHPGDVFYDVGANRGLFTIMAARALGPSGVVYAFEPERTAFEVLQRNIALNELTNVRAMPSALSDHNGSANLSPAADLIQTSRLVENASLGTYHVEIATGDSLALPVPAVIKIDVEGHEYAVLRGMTKLLAHENCRAVFCEVHPDVLPQGVTLSMIQDFVRSAGFGRTTTSTRGAQVHLGALK